MTTRIVSANIQNGVGVTRSYRDYALVGWKYVLPHAPTALEGLIPLIESRSIDVLALSEVEGGSFRSRGLNYASWLAERTSLHHHVFFPTFKRSLRGRVLSHQGNAVLSRFPITAHDAIRLPGSGESRFLCEATVESADKPLSIFTTHVSLRKRERHDQLLTIARIVGERSGPRLLMGDLNTSDLEELREIEAAGLSRLSTGPTFPSWAPRRCLDHVFTSRECRDAFALALEDVRVADHLPLLVQVS